MKKRFIIFGAGKIGQIVLERIGAENVKYFILFRAAS